MRNFDAETFLDYAAWLNQQNLSAAYTQSCLSTINCLMAVMRREWKPISPTLACGRQRERTRRQPPGSIDWSRVDQVVEDLEKRGFCRAAAIFYLGRAFGVRRVEATLADLTRWQREMHSKKKVNIREGTKNGRKLDRWINVSERGMKALAYAIGVRPIGSCNLLVNEETTIEFERGEIFHARKVLKENGIPHFHDARAAYACQRYQELTGYPAPVETGLRLATRDEDHRARIILTVELGHGRVEVVGSYCGGTRAIAVPEID